MALVTSIRDEFLRYKALAEAAIGQLSEQELVVEQGAGGNSIAVICWHMSGNLSSRFTDFLTADGEKPWRHRDEEFESRAVSRVELLEKWERGWAVLLGALADLTDDQLTRTVTIRRQPLQVHEALHRSLAHASYHVGQIVYIAKTFRGDAWRSLSIPRGQSEAANRASAPERAADHAARLNPDRSR